MADEGDRKLKRKRAKNILVSFSKRRKSLFRKASELCNKCEAEVAILVVSQAGNTYSFGHPSVDHVLRRFSDEQSPAMSIESDRLKKKARELEELRVRARERERFGSNFDGFEFDQCESVGELESLKAKCSNLLEKVRLKLGNNDEENFKICSDCNYQDYGQEEKGREILEPNHMSIFKGCSSSFSFSSSSSSEYPKVESSVLKDDCGGGNEDDHIFDFITGDIGIIRNDFTSYQIEDFEFDFTF